MIEPYFKKNSFWQTPILPPIPDNVFKKENRSICLSNRQLGEWQFLFNTLDNIPSPYAVNQDYDFTTIIDGWQDVIVPCSLIMQGFDIQNNQEYYYKTTIKPQKLDNGERSFVRFEGVYCNARVWLNNHYVATHIGGFTAWDVELTNYCDCDAITIILGIADIETSNTGIWNPNGISMSDASWASYYAHHNICGILRDVTLYYLESSHIIRTSINTILDKAYQNAEIELTSLCSLVNNCNIEVSIYNGLELLHSETHNLSNKYLLEKNNFCQNNKINYSDDYRLRHPYAYLQDNLHSARYINHSDYKITNDIYSFKINFPIESPILWNAETPHLYKLVIRLLKDDVELQCNILKLGIRQIDYAGSNNTDKNKIYINGKQVKLRGVCRHDVSYQYGRSISKEDAYAEIRAYKNNNVNFIRTSHYPASKYTLDACDELGMYVEQENAVCFKGANNYHMLCPPEQLVNNMAEMVAHDRNHTSIIIWSLGNESGFEKSYGFRSEYNYIKQEDKTRPIIFSYPFKVSSKPLPYDIFSKHYANVTASNLGNKDMPVLHDEFAHVSCYNVAELTTDNEYRLAWGNSIRLGWDNIFHTDGALGCAIWCSIDDVFYIPDGTKSAHQRHSPGKAVGYGEWGAIQDAFQREKPEAFLTKKAFSPIKIISVAIRKNTLYIEIENRFDHTDISNVELLIHDSIGNKVYIDKINEHIAPHSHGSITLPEIFDNMLSYNLSFQFQGFTIETYNLRSENDNHYKKSTQSNYRKLSDNEFIISDKIFNLNKKDSILSVFVGNNQIATMPHFYGGKTKLVSQKRTIEKYEINDEKALIIIVEKFKSCFNVNYRITADKTGLQIEQKLKHVKPSLAFGNGFGNYLLINKNINNIEWERKEEIFDYPPDHLGRTKGTAYNTRKNYDSALDKYGVKPMWDWKLDMVNYFLTEFADDKEIKVTNDFMTTRTNINHYAVNFKDNASLGITNLADSFDCLTSIEKQNDSIFFGDSGIKVSGWRKIRRTRGQSYYKSKKRGSTLSVEFIGNGIKLIGTLSKKQGDVLIAVDNKPYGKLSTRSDICKSLANITLMVINNLPLCKHTLTITAADSLGAKFNRFDVLNDSKNTQAKLIVSQGKYYSCLAWGNYFGKIRNPKSFNLKYLIK